MGTDGLGKKLAFAAAAMAAILLVLRVVGGGDGQGADEDDIDRVDTGRSSEEDGGPVETGLDRVGTDDDAETGAGSDEDETGDGESEVAVEATRGRFESLDLFDYVAIAGAAFEAAREEYRNRI